MLVPLTNATFTTQGLRYAREKRQRLLHRLGVELDDETYVARPEIPFRPSLSQPDASSAFWAEPPRYQISIFRCADATHRTEKIAVKNHYVFVKQKAARFSPFSKDQDLTHSMYSASS